MIRIETRMAAGLWAGIAGAAPEHPEEAATVLPAWRYFRERAHLNVLIGTSPNG